MKRLFSGQQKKKAGNIECTPTEARRRLIRVEKDISKITNAPRKSMIAVKVNAALVVVHRGQK